MNKVIRIFVKDSIFKKYEQYAFVYDPDFIIPENGDIICLSEEQIRIWNGEYSNKLLKVQFKQYTYKQDSEGKDMCDIVIYVKPLKNSELL